MADLNAESPVSTDCIVANLGLALVSTLEARESTKKTHPWVQASRGGRPLKTLQRTRGGTPSRVYYG
ncbi:hypothetical protein BDR04DRAFT_338823 [Suillus decipiens]|nr:hypothetical protein BDR04DRAFT_338823 [Suillus decipiens]